MKKFTGQSGIYFCPCLTECQCFEVYEQGQIKIEGRGLKDRQSRWEKKITILQKKKKKRTVPNNP